VKVNDELKHFATFSGTMIALVRPTDRHTCLREHWHLRQKLLVHGAAARTVLDEQVTEGDAIERPQSTGGRGANRGGARAIVHERELAKHAGVTIRKHRRVILEHVKRARGNHVQTVARLALANHEFADRNAAFAHGANDGRPLLVLHARKQKALVERARNGLGLFDRFGDRGAGEQLTRLKAVELVGLGADRRTALPTATGDGDGAAWRCECGVGRGGRGRGRKSRVIRGRRGRRRRRRQWLFCRARYCGGRRRQELRSRQRWHGGQSRKWKKRQGRMRW
jgi:hypothetical protein